jgi:hypothetical protein
MREQSDHLLIAVVSALTFAAAVILAGEARPDAGRETRSVEFQHLVGGLGFGPSTDLSPCPVGFDPRLGSGCAADVGPVLGGHDFCPCHAGSVFYYAPPGPEVRPHEQAS